MIRTLLLAAVVAANGWATATTYTFAAQNYASLSNFSTCGAGPCATYTSAMKISGSVTLASALAPNISGGPDLTSQITAFSFSDGINTYANTNPATRVYQFSANTDASGNIIIGSFLVELWQTGTSPHAVGDRFAEFNLNGSNINQGQNNLKCLIVGASPSSGVADLCQSGNADTSSSVASVNQGTWTGNGGTPTPTPSPTGVPTLGEWGMIALAGLLVLFASSRLAGRTSGS